MALCCLQTFPPVEVIGWIDDGDTPLCPYCGIAAVPPGVTDLVELLRLQERRFGRSRADIAGRGGVARGIDLCGGIGGRLMAG